MDTPRNKQLQRTADKGDSSSWSQRILLQTEEKKKNGEKDPLYCQGQWPNQEEEERTEKTSWYKRRGGDNKEEDRKVEDTKVKESGRTPKTIR